MQTSRKFRRDVWTYDASGHTRFIYARARHSHVIIACYGITRACMTTTRVTPSETLKKHPGWRMLSKPRLREMMVSRDMTDLPFKTRKEFDVWWDSDDASAQSLPGRLEVNGRQVVKKARRSPFGIVAPPYSFQVDVTVVQPPEPKTGRDRFLLLVEINSRKAFASTLRTNEASEVTETYDKMMKTQVLPDIPLYAGEDDTTKGRLQHVWLVMGDNFFSNKSFIDLNHDMGIQTSTVVAKDEHWSVSGNSLGIVDACTKTLKAMMRRERTASGAGFRWTEKLEEIIMTYNATKGHSALPKGMTPNDVYNDRHEIAKLYWAKADRRRQGMKTTERLPIGTEVRIVIRKASKVHKGPAFTLSPQVYKIQSHVGINRYELEGSTRRPRLSDVVAVKNAKDFTEQPKEPSRQSVTLRAEVGQARDAPTPSPGKAVTRPRKKAPSKPQKPVRRRWFDRDQPAQADMMESQPPR